MKRIAAWMLLALAGGPAGPAFAATLTVDSTADDFDQPANGNCTLREAIRAANTNTAVDGCGAGDPGPATVDVVVIPAGAYGLTLGPRGDDDAAHGDLDLTDDVELQGAGADLTRIDAGRVDRVFDVHGGVIAVLSGLEIAGGDAVDGNGGGIQNAGDLTLIEVAVSDNRAEGPGGGIRNDSLLAVRRSLIAANVTADHGGGVDNHGDATFENVTVSGNDGSNLGGGLYNLGGMSMTVTHVTVTGNSADAGAAIHNAGDLTAAGSLIAGPCSGSVDTSGGGNLESPGDTCGLGVADQVAVADPLLGPLTANGGPTHTHVLLAGSPAIDAALAAACPTTDQRQAPRPADGDGDTRADCDVGAYEAPAPLSEIFVDGFETGDLSRWR